MAESTETDILSLGEAVQATLNDVVRQIVDYAPEVLGAAVVLLVGWLAAKALAMSAQKLTQSLDSLFTRFGSSDDLKNKKFKSNYPKAVSKAVFWIVILFFLAVASNILGWDIFSGWMQSVFSYIPGIITGVIIIIGGLILGNFTRSAVISAGGKAELHQRAFIAKLVQIAIVFSAILIGVDQIGLNINFLSNIVVTVIGIILAGAALAFALGARDLMANVIGARYLQRHCEIGDHISIGSVEGEVLEISQASIVIQTENGKAIVPAELFHRKITLIKTQRH